ncbi:MAG: hypothetical protein PHD48_03745 [Alphaproteobacteria bacterium]|nr:hypothetical protein [Alphaproteobacteria bacterium]
MVKVTFSKPFDLTQEEHALYEEVGVVFSDHTKDGSLPKRNEFAGDDWYQHCCKLSGYVAVSANVETYEAIERISLLPTKNIQKLIELCAYSPLYEGIKDAQAMHLLRKMAENSTDNFPLPYAKRPFTWAVNTHIPDEIEELNKKLQKQGIDQVRVGMEIEFSLPEEPLQWIKKAEEVKAEILGEISDQIKQSPHNERTVLLEKKKELVEQFNAREILMFDMIERDEKTKDILEPLFGTGRDGNGYYDAEGTLELKIKHCDSRDIIQNRRTVLRTLFRKASELGLLLDTAPTQHVNISFWKDEQNLFDEAHPEFLITGKKIMEGITKAFYETCPVLITDLELNEPLPPLSCSANREEYLRSSTGRLEVRPSQYGTHQDPDFITMVAMAGGLYGLESMNNDAQQRAIITTKGNFSHTEGLFKVTSHVLSNSTVTDKGLIIPPSAYIEQKAQSIAFELGLTTISPSSLEQCLGGKSLFADPLNNFFKQVKIRNTPSGLSVQWPETKREQYAFTTPEINMHLLPADLQERVRGGKELPEQLPEGLSIKLWGKDLPKAAQTYTINTATLSKNIQLHSFSKRLIIPNGYNMNTTQGGASIEQSRLQRMAESSVLKKCLRDETFQEIQKSLYENFNFSPRSYIREKLKTLWQQRL